MTDQLIYRTASDIYPKLADVKLYWYWIIPISAPMQIQQDAFIIAQEFAANWDAMVFISVRPQTFFQSKRAGALAAYPHRVFTISPPRPELVIEKRLEFALKLAEGTFPPNMHHGFSIHTTKLPLFIKTLLYSIEHNSDIREILSNITAGNIRSVVEFVVKFIGSPNVEAEKDNTNNGGARKIFDSNS